MAKPKKGIRAYVFGYLLRFLLFLASLLSSIIAFLSVIKYCVSRSKATIEQDRTLVPKILQSDAYGSHNYIQLKTVKLHYVENGDKTKQLIIFVHSFKEFWFFWREQLTNYGQHLRAIAVDLRGYDGSEKFPEISSYKLKILTKDLKHFIEALSANKKVILVGHGWGGIIVHNLVSRHPELVEKYVTFGAVPPYSFSLSINQLVKLWRVYFIQLRFLPEYYFLSYDMHFFFTDDLQNELDVEILEAYKYTFCKPGVMTCVLNHYRANAWKIGLASMFRNWSLAKQDSQRFPPGLLLYNCTKENAFIDESSYKNASKIVPNVKVVKLDDNSYKYLLTNRLPKFNNLVTTFLNDKSSLSVDKTVTTHDPDVDIDDSEDYTLLMGDIR